MARFELRLERRLIGPIHADLPREAIAFATAATAHGLTWTAIEWKMGSAFVAFEGPTEAIEWLCEHRAWSALQWRHELYRLAMLVKLDYGLAPT